MSELTANQAQFKHALDSINRQMNQRSYDFSQYINSSDTKHQDCFDSYGWPEKIVFDAYWGMYSRSTYAAAMIDKVVDKCWQNSPWLMMSEERKAEKMNAQEKKLNDFAKRHNLWFKLQELDRMQKIGQYGALVIEVRDGAQLTEPMKNIREGQISNLLVCTEGMLQPMTYDDDPKSDRYGLPNTYQLDRSEFGDQNPQTASNLPVHHSRVIVWAEGAVNDGIFGRSDLMKPFNTLLSLQKISGAGPEGFWQASRGSFTMTMEKDADLGKLAQTFGVELDELPDALGEAIENFRRNYDNILAIQGGKFEPLTFSLPSPKDYVDALLSELAAGGVPLTELIGQQVDERSSTENGKQFAGTCETRQNGFLNRGVKQVFEWFMRYGVLPKSDFCVCWEELYQPSLEQKLDLVAKMADINLKRAQAMQTLMNASADDGKQPAYVFDVNQMLDVAGYDGIALLEATDYGETDKEEEDKKGA